MSRLPGSWGWRDEQLASAEHSGQQIDDPSEDNPWWLDELIYWADVARRHPGVVAAIGVVVVLLMVLVLRKSPPAHPLAASHRPAAQTYPTQAPKLSTQTPWSAAEQKPFSSGLVVSLTTPGVLPRTGPAQLWPIVSGATAIPTRAQLVALGLVNNSQESDRWVAVRLPAGDVGWLPVASVIYSGTLRMPPSGPPASYVIIGDKPIQILDRAGLPDLGGAVPQGAVITTLSPSSVLPLAGVLPRYFDGKAGTAWLRVELPDGSYGWLQQAGSNMRRDIRYLLPPPGSSGSAWVSPLPQGDIQLGAYGDTLGTPQWPVRGGTDVRGKAGERVQAVAPGEVIFVGHSVRWARDYVVVRHTGVWAGWQTAYMGLISTGKQSVPVHEGDTVQRGQLLGYLAPGAYQQPTSLHFVVQTPDGTPIESQNVIQWP